MERMGTKPRIELGRHRDGTLDEVVAREIESIHSEQLDDGLIWLAVYFKDGERLTLNFYVTGPKDIEYEYGELPEWAGDLARTATEAS